MKKNILILAGMLFVSGLIPGVRAEMLIDSTFTSNVGNWYAMKNLGSASFDQVARVLQIKVNQSGECRIANWKRITPEMCAGKVVKLQASVKGRGTLTPVFVVTVKSASGGNSHLRHAGKCLQLSGDFAAVEFSLDLGEFAPLSVEPRFELKGEDARACFKRIKCETEVVANSVLSPLFSYIAVQAGASQAEIVLNSEPGANIRIFNQGNSAEISADPSGRAVTSIAAEKLTVPALLQLTAGYKGAAEKIFVEIIPPEEFKTLSAMAQECKLTGAESILILGDSLSDFDRGRNYVDQLNFYLNAKASKPGISFYNYGIGGDDIRRVSRRLAHHFNPGTPNEYFQKRYRGIGDRKYDYILIFLGQNDTKASSQSNYETTFVFLPECEKYWELLIAELKKQFPDAKPILCSPIHVDSARQEVIAQAVLKSKPNVWKFGIESHMENYDALIRKLAKKHNALYLDLYTPSKMHPTPETLFKSEDGVHLSVTGERFVTGRILDFLRTAK